MQQEDDLRGLAKTMGFMRAIMCDKRVLVLLRAHKWGINIGVVDNILMNFQLTTGLFSSILWTKIFAVIFLALSCLGIRGVKDEKIKWRNIYLCLFFGFFLFFLNWWLLEVPTVSIVPKVTKRTAPAPALQHLIKKK